MDLIDLIFNYVPLDYVLIIGGLIVIGEMFKKYTTLPNYFLTTVLPVLGAVLTAIIYATSVEVLIVADLIKQICIGLLMGWAATGGYEWFRNTFLVEKEERKVIAREPINKNEEQSNVLPIEETQEVTETEKEN
jgi:hypothetical protein